MEDVAALLDSRTSRYVRHVIQLRHTFLAISVMVCVTTPFHDNVSVRKNEPGSSIGQKDVRQEFFLHLTPQKHSSTFGATSWEVPAYQTALEITFFATLDLFVNCSIKLR